MQGWKGSAVAKKSTSKKKKAPRKTTTKKKSSSSKASARKKTTSKKKVTKKKKAPAKKKTSSKKKSTSKKKSAAKTTRKKSTSTKKKKKKKKKAAASSDTSNNGKATGAAAKTTKKTTKKKTKKKTKSKSSAVKIGRGRSVAEVASTATADEQGYVIINGRRVRMISTKGITAAKATRTSSVKDAEVATDKPAKPIKTKLTKRQLDHYQKLLIIKRAEIVGDLSTMEAEALRSSDGDLSNMPIHMADLGSDTYEQDLMLGMAQNERERIRDIDEALQRIVERTYGICMMTGETIPKARLEAKPWAKYTIEAARKLEGSWGPR